MMPWEIEAYRKAYNVRQVERCCGTCNHFGRDYEHSGCYHKKQADFDKFAEKRQQLGFPPDVYGPYGCGVQVDEGFVCDLWEKGGEA